MAAFRGFSRDSQNRPNFDIFEMCCFPAHSSTQTRENKMKRKLVYNCENCDDFRTKWSSLKEERGGLLAQIKKKNEKIVSLSDSVEYWKKKALLLEAQVMDCRCGDPLALVEAGSAVCSPTDLEFDNFGLYCEELLKKQPDLGAITQPLFSKSFKDAYKRKCHDSSVWFGWASFYKVFLFDAIIRSKNPKAVLRTNLALGIALYRCKLPEYAWRILQRLKILPCVQYVENYLSLLPEPVFSDKHFLFFNYDNFDIHRHITKHTSEHHSEMRHYVSRMVYDIPKEINLEVTQVYQTYNNEEAVKFARFLVPDYASLCKLANNAAECVHNAREFGGFKNCLKNEGSRIPKVTLTVLPAEIDRQTASYDDNVAIVRNLWEQYAKPLDMKVALFGGDWQTFTRMYDMKIKNLQEMGFCIPFPGEWHWSWHILQGIFKKWGHDILIPFSQVLTYKNLKIKEPEFHYAEHFLEKVTLALEEVMHELQLLHPDMSVIEILSHYKECEPVYELVYMYIWHVCPYWYTRAALKIGNSRKVNSMWRYWLHLFIAAKKTNYAIMTIRFLWLTKYLHPSIMQIINVHRVFSFTGEPNTGVPLDGVNELVRKTVAFFHLSASIDFNSFSHRLTGILKR
jgi:hypothetical protein